MKHHLNDHMRPINLLFWLFLSCCSLNLTVAKQHEFKSLNFSVNLSAGWESLQTITRSHDTNSARVFLNTFQRKGTLLYVTNCERIGPGMILNPKEVYNTICDNALRRFYPQNTLEEKEKSLKGISGYYRYVSTKDDEGLNGQAIC